MLGNNYLTFNSVVLPNPVSFDISFQNIETIKQSVAGTDMGIVTRLQKRTFKGTWQVSSTWLNNFKTLCALSTATLVYLNESITCRARISSQKLAKNSEYAARTDGLWTISVTFTEV